MRRLRRLALNREPCPRWMAIGWCRFARARCGLRLVREWTAHVSSVLKDSHQSRVEVLLAALAPAFFGWV